MVVQEMLSVAKVLWSASIHAKKVHDLKCVAFWHILAFLCSHVLHDTSWLFCSHADVKILEGFILRFAVPVLSPSGQQRLVKGMASAALAPAGANRNPKSQKELWKVKSWSAMLRARPPPLKVGEAQCTQGLFSLHNSHSCHLIFISTYTYPYTLHCRL